jgi:site-specific recombinase XerD
MAKLKSRKMANSDSIDLKDNNFLINNFLSTKRSKPTKEIYNFEIRKFLEWYEQKPLVDVSSWDMLKYNQYLQEKYDNEKTLQRIYATIRSFYDWLIKMNVISTNPTEGAIQPLTPQQDVSSKVLTSEEINALIDVASKNIRDLALVSLMLKVGLRVSEVCDLNWSDLRIDPDGGYYIHVHRKGNEEQDLGIGNDVAEVLLEYREKPLNPRDESPVFTVTYGKQLKRLTDEGIRVIVKKLSEKANIRHISPHWLRHTFASYAVHGGCPITDLQRCLNHKSPKTTEIYMHSLTNNISKYINIDLRKGE